MYKTHIRFLAVAFVDANSVTPNGTDIAELLQAFNFTQLVPTGVQEQTPTGINNRVGFVSPDGSWQILLLSGQFHVARITTNPLGSDFGSFSNFCQQASTVLKKLLGTFQRRPHRLAAVREGYLREMSNDETTQLAQRLLNYSDTYRNNPLVEWDWRIATQVNREIGGILEPTNTITAIKRLAGVLTSGGNIGIPVQTAINRIKVDFDINTASQNTAARFLDLHIDSFFSQAELWHSELASEIATLMGVESHNV